MLYSDKASVCYILMEHQCDYILMEHQCVCILIEYQCVIFLWNSSILYSNVASVLYI